MHKVILILVDGMRPDGFLACGHPFTREMMRRGSYTLNARTVFPSVTLPCHLSLFHSVPPERHGVLTNTYVPFPRPVKGLFETLDAAGRDCAFFYNWEPLRDIGRPGSLRYAQFIDHTSAPDTDSMLTESALELLRRDPKDFIFLYLVETDESGHDYGWMSEQYLERIRRAVGHIKSVTEAAGDEYTVIVTADHGGHGRTHGTELEEDMTIPMFFMGPDFPAGQEMKDVSILDIAPTVTALMGARTPAAWEGKSLLRQ